MRTITVRFAVVFFLVLVAGAVFAQQPPAVCEVIAETGERVGEPTAAVSSAATTRELPPAPVPGQRVLDPGEIPAAPAHPLFNSWAEALAYINGQPIAVVRVRAHDPYRDQQQDQPVPNGGRPPLYRAGVGFQPGYQYGTGGLGFAVYGGGFGSPVGYQGAMYVPGYGGGIGGGGLTFSDVDPDAVLSSVVQTRIEHALRLMRANVIVPRTGPSSDELNLISAETHGGKNAGVWSDRGAETARFIVAVSFAFDDDDTKSRGFLAFTFRQNRNLKVRIFAKLQDVKTHQLLYIAEGSARVESREFGYTDVLGVFHSNLRSTNAQPIAEAMVVALFQPPPAGEQRALLETQRQVKNLEADRKALEERRKLKVKMHKEREKIAKLKARR